MLGNIRLHSTARALLCLPVVLGAACSDATNATRATVAGPSFSSSCGIADHATFTYYRDANKTFSGTSTLYTGEYRWVEIDVRDYYGCRLFGSELTSVTVTNTSLVGLQVANSTAPVYRLQALASNGTSLELRVVADGRTFASTIWVNSPTVRMYTAAGTEITSALPVEVDIWTGVTAKAFAGSSGPVIATAGWPSQPVWSTGSSAAAVSNNGTTADAAQASVKGVTVGNTTLSVQMLGVTRSVSVTVQAKRAVASVTVSGPSPLTQGHTGDYTAVPRDAGGNVLPGRTVSWSVDNTAVATINSTGRVTAVGPGTTTVRATIDGKQGTAPLQVNGTPGVTLGVTYPGGVPTLSWSTTFSGTHNVYILREEEITDLEFGNSYTEYMEFLGSTSGTSFQDLNHSFTSETAWSCQEGGGYWFRTVKSFYVVVPASSPSVQSNRDPARIMPIGEPCWSP